MAGKKKQKAKKKTAAKRATAKKKPDKKIAKATAKSVAHAIPPAGEKGKALGERTHGGIQHFSWRREHYKTLREFWPFYLHEHSSARNRLLHFIGSSLGLVIFVSAFLSGTYLLILPALISGYAFAWFGHFFIEKNRPATFKYPLKSFLSDWRMWWTMVTRKIATEYKKFGIPMRP